MARAFPTSYEVGYCVSSAARTGFSELSSVSTNSLLGSYSLTIFAFIVTAPTHHNSASSKRSLPPCSRMNSP